MYKKFKMDCNDLLLNNKFALVQFTCDSIVSIVETRNVFRSKEKGKDVVFSFERKWKVGIHQGAGEGKLKYFEAVILLLASKSHSSMFQCVLYCNSYHFYLFQRIELN